MTIVFRVDASVRMGMGHISRCLTLANGWRKRGQQCHFICRQLPGLPIDHIRSQGHQLTLLPHPQAVDVLCDHQQWLVCDNATDATETLNAFAHQTPAWLIVDHYAIAKEWQQQIRQSQPQLKIMVIDDLADREHLADLLLDQTLDRQAADYAGKIHPECQLLLGANYALLRPEFNLQRNAALKRRQTITTPNRVLIAPGGSDPSAIGERALQAIEQLQTAGWTLSCTMLVSAATPHLQRYRRYADEGRWQLALDANNVAELMRDHDLAIGAAGTSSWERCVLAMPTLLVISAANQQAVAQALAVHGAVMAIGDDANVSQDTIANALITLLSSPDAYQLMAAQAAQQVDGLGMERVLQQMLRHINASLRLVPMQQQDCELLFAWQQLPTIRKYARNPQPPTAKEHSAWFHASLSNPLRQLLRIDIGQHPVGMVRIDEQPDNDHRGEISILIDPQWQGLGIAAHAIRQAMHRSELPGWVAEVSINNQASQRLFTRLGFQRDAPHRFSLTREALAMQHHAAGELHG